jgi:glutamine synthetase
MFKDFEIAKQYIENNHIRMVDLKWCDYSGRWHHITVSAQYFSPSMMKNGIGFDGSSVGFKPVNAGDMVLSFLCNIYEADTKRQFSLDPREFVRRAEKYMQDTKIADRSLWGPEFEFFIFDEVLFNNRLNSCSYYVNSNEATWEEDQGFNGYLVPKSSGYHRIPPSDQNNNLRNKISISLEDLGYAVKYHHHEAGGPGHGEIEPPMLDIIKSTDGTLVTKYLAKNFAYQFGKTLTFIPKPLFGEAGNGMHVHQLLMKGDRNVFYDPDGFSQLSISALYYIGGILSHARALCALTNPSTNSYKRLTPGFEAPVNCFFGKGDRSAAIRVPKYATDPSEVRIEYRTPDCTCNPYIALPAMLLAGLDGIINKIDPREHNFGPFEEDIFTWSAEKRSIIKNMPFSLDSALDALEQDNNFLINNDVFSKEFINFWIEMKRKESIDIYSRPHPAEIEQYLDC